MGGVVWTALASLALRAAGAAAAAASRFDRILVTPERFPRAVIAARWWPTTPTIVAVKSQGRAADWTDCVATGTTTSTAQRSAVNGERTAADAASAEWRASIPGGRATTTTFTATAHERTWINRNPATAINAATLHERARIANIHPTAAANASAIDG